MILTYQRILKASRELNPKYPDGVEAQFID
jgi:hypothetical protein